jgi:hypothetical protein
LNQFGHIIVSCSPPNTCNYYFNGALVATYSMSMTTQTYSYVAGLGKSSCNDGYFQGEIADFRFFNRALTSDEVTAIYTGNECGVSSCTAWYYYKLSTASCVVCPSNSNSNAGAYTCLCSAGYYQTGYGVGLSCTICPAGSISTLGLYSCTCPSGYIISGYRATVVCTPFSCPISATALKGDNQIFPNPSLSIANGASVASNPLTDIGLSSSKYTITAGSGVTYDGNALKFDGSSNAWVSFGSSVSFGGQAFSISVWAMYTSFSSYSGGPSYGRNYDLIKYQDIYPRTIY